jgi:ABC-type polar amino acid transport system ATPase subunit
VARFEAVRTAGMDSIGSGKSTLLRCINLLEQPNAGHTRGSPAKCWRSERLQQFLSGNLK